MQSNPPTQPEGTREKIAAAIKRHVRHSFERRQGHGVYHWSGIDAATDAILALLAPASPAVGDVAGAAQFLIDRLADFAPQIDDEETIREYDGHVLPAIARLKYALATPVPPEVMHCGVCNGTGESPGDYTCVHCAGSGRVIPVPPPAAAGEETKTVPVEPTREMWAAMGDAALRLGPVSHDAISEAVWKAALKAAPPSPARPEATAAESGDTVVWRATCGVCDAAWKVPQGDNPAPHGSFCPDCQARGMKAPGVLHWSATPTPDPVKEAREALEGYRRAVNSLLRQTATDEPDGVRSSYDQGYYDGLRWAREELLAAFNNDRDDRALASLDGKGA